MVKRAISIVLGAAAGVALWFVYDAVRAEGLHSDPDAQGCVRGDWTECVGYVTPVEALRPVPAAQPCKIYLGTSSGASLAILSQCLHAARRQNDGGRVEQIKRARAIATSS
ncbi:MAG: hypothetical protein ABL996_03235 [Micropepsaceae bacterium]